MNVTRAEAIAREFVGHVIALVVAAVAAWAANHGWHLGIPAAVPAAISVTALAAFVRLAAHAFAKSWRSGKLEAELLVIAKRELPVVISDVEKEI